jgi:hypothetical protein
MLVTGQREQSPRVNKLPSTNAFAFPLILNGNVSAGWRADSYLSRKCRLEASSGQTGGVECRNR